MGARGPKPKPTALRILEGNPSHRPLPENEPKPQADKVKCPNWLSPDAKKEWRRLASSMVSMGVLTNADVQSFAAYCQCYAIWKEAMLKAMATGLTVETSSGYIMKNPELSIAQSALTQMKQFAGEFGLTPSARSRINAGSANAKDIEEDPMESVLRQAWK